MAEVNSGQIHGQGNILEKKRQSPELSQPPHRNAAGSLFCADLNMCTLLLPFWGFRLSFTLPRGVSFPLICLGAG